MPPGQSETVAVRNQGLLVVVEPDAHPGNVHRVCARFRKSAERSVTTLPVPADHTGNAEQAFAEAASDARGSARHAPASRRLGLARRRLGLLGRGPGRGLRRQLSAEAKNHNINVYFPPLSVCTDNAAMIAGLGFHLIKKRRQ